MIIYACIIHLQDMRCEIQDYYDGGGCVKNLPGYPDAAIWATG